LDQFAGLRPQALSKARQHLQAFCCATTGFTPGLARGPWHIDVGCPARACETAACGWRRARSAPSPPNLTYQSRLSSLLNTCLWVLNPPLRTRRSPS